MYSIVRFTKRIIRDLVFISAIISNVYDYNNYLFLLFIFIKCFIVNIYINVINEN